MKKLLFTLIISLPAFSGWAQNPFHDALYLQKYATLSGNKVKIDVNSMDSAKVLEIFGKYIRDEQSVESDFNIINENPFISIEGQTQSGSGILAAGVSSTLSDIGSLNVTNFADGLARFLVERTKEELSVTFFEKFRNELDTIKQLQLLFPTTYQNLMVIGDEIYQFSGYIEMLRQGFQKDLAHILPNLQNLVDDKSMNEVFSRYPALRILLSDGLFLAIQLKDGYHIGDALDHYIKTEARRDELMNVHSNLYPSLVVLDILSQSLRADSNHYWIQREQLRKLENEKTFKIYMGLVYQQLSLFQEEHDSIIFQVNDADKNILLILRESSAGFEELRDRMKNIFYPLLEEGRHVHDKFEQIRKLQAREGTEPGYQEFYELMDASIDLIETVEIAAEELTGQSAPPAFDKFISSARTLGNIYVDVNQKQYVSAISELAYLYDELVVNKLKENVEMRKQFANEFDSILKNDNSTNMKGKLSDLITDYETYLPMSDTLRDLVGTYEDPGKLRKKFKELEIEKYELALAEKQEKVTAFLVRYGNFAAIIAKAENSEQVQDAIEAVALPAGSARIKRESARNISINSYVGLYGGTENIEINGNAKYRPAGGLFAPVGIAYSWGGISPKKYKGSNSFSIFVSLIDIGALASFRFNDDQTESVPDIELRDIISPGLFGIWGFRGSPLSAGAGAQIGPRLHEVSATDVSTISDHYVRFSVFLTVDIPLLNLYTKTR